MKYRGFNTIVLLPAAALLGILMAGYLYGIWRYQQRDLREDFLARLESSQILLKTHTEADVKLLATAVELISRDEKLQDLWRQRNRAAIEEYAKPLFKKFSEQYGITHFYFHEPNRVCYLRVHQPEQYGDTIDRQTLFDAQQSGGIGTGIELGSLGTLTLRVVKPWKFDDRVEGYLELGEEVTRVTKEIAQTLNVETAVLIEKKYLDRQGWESGMGLHDRSTNWADLPSEVVIDCPSADIAPKTFAGVATIREKRAEEVSEIQVNGIPYLAGAVPLVDCRNREVGRMVLLDDIAAERASLRFYTTKLGSFFLVMAAVCLAGFYLYLKYIEKILDRSQRQALQAMKDREADQARHVEEMLKFRKAIDLATDAIFINDLNRKLHYVNSAFERLFGFSLEEANEHGGTASLYCNQQMGVKAFLQVSQGRQFSAELEMRAKDGRAVQVFLRASPIVNSAGEMTGILGICTDLSERKSTELKLLRQVKELREINRTLLKAKKACEEEKVENEGRSLTANH